MLAEDLLRREARLEPVGPWALGACGRHAQVGLQLGLQVLGEGGTEGSGHAAAPGPALKDQSLCGQDSPGLRAHPFPFSSLKVYNQTRGCKGVLSQPLPETAPLGASVSSSVQ